MWRYRFREVSLILNVLATLDEKKNAENQEKVSVELKSTIIAQLCKRKPDCLG